MICNTMISEGVPTVLNSTRGQNPLLFSHLYICTVCKLLFFFIIIIIINAQLPASGELIQCIAPVRLDWYTVGYLRIKIV